MKTVAIIPARFGSTRFPGKMLALLQNKPVIVHTYESVFNTGLFDEVIVACDDEAIYKAIQLAGGKVVMTSPTHLCGTDRIAEAAGNLDADIVVNIQGDEPFTQREPLEKLLAVFRNDAKAEIEIASLMQPLRLQEQIEDPNFVKVAIDLNGFALYFSRSVIPYNRNSIGAKYYEHIGVYAFRKSTLLKVTKLAPTPLEMAEQIECLRWLEHRIPLKMVITEYNRIEIDTPEDLAMANDMMNRTV
jgi:3-deoxy-manno-octulosonate cytidylyltransferase (CMP-KDO synthetase)